jgi:hypothetical protein
MLTLAVELGVPPNGSTRMTLLATRVPSAAFTIDQVSAARSRRAKLRLVLRAVVPPPHIMRYWFPRAPPGRLGLVVAYLSRPVSIATRLIPAVRAWRRAANARKVA